MTTLYFLFMITAWFLSPFAAADCTFNLDTSSPTYPPHIVDPVSKLIIQPTLVNGVRTLNVALNKQVLVACEGSGNVLTATGQQVNPATCSASGDSLLVGTASLRYSSLGCNAAVKETVKETGTCMTTGTLVEIGWQVNSTLFINQITVCHDKATANTLYSVDTIYGASIAAGDKDSTRPSFRKSTFYAGVNVDNAYSQAGQNVTVAQILSSTSLAVRYIDVSNSYYFARGHLSPDADFVDKAGQDATYYYINAAPQWQSFNNGNWKVLEMNTRDLASSRALSLKTYTGTFGVVTLPDVNGVQQAIYLAKDANNNAILPAPKYYWKVVHDPVSNSATAFVGINNPHLQTITGADVFCSDVCGQVSSWATWTNRYDISKGYMFCCTVQSLRNVIPHSPDLGDLPLLI